MRARNKVGLVLVLAVAAAAALISVLGARAEHVRTQLACGKARWDVKTLSDPDASSVSLQAIKAGVADLAALPAPAHIPNTLPRQTGFGRVEFHTFRVKADLYGWKRSADDNDVHLVIQGPSSTKTMIVEFPNADCIPAAAPANLRARMVTARASLMSACASVPFTATFRRLSGSATIVGVGFFDRKHHQTGVADNAIELHPVLKFSSANCGPF